MQAAVYCGRQPTSARSVTWLHDIIDNRDEKLIDHTRRILPDSSSAKLAVGYFFLSDLEAVAEQLSNVQELQLPFGNAPSRQTIEQITRR
jgi:hypothetical protein